MLYILSGQDDFSLTRTLEGIKRDIGDQSALAAGATLLEGHQVTIEQLRPFCETASFLSERRLVIIRGLMERFEPRRKTGRQKRTVRVKEQQTDGYLALGDYLTRIPDSTVVVLIEGRITNNNPLFQLLASKAVVKTFPLLKDAQLRQWIQGRVKEEGGSISPQAVNSLVQLVGSNLWVMTSEIGKLVLFAAGRRIEEDDVEALVGYAQQASVFAVSDAVVEFKAELAEQLLQRLWRGGAAPAYLLVMLARQVQMIVRARELSKEKIPKAEIQRILGLPSEYAVRRTMEQATRYSLARLREVYRQLLAADLSIKTGKCDGELALDILVAELCRVRQARIA